ncbi:MAG: hypothetical protein MJ033_01025 [Victivallaceae bacterium]|nr:hypothetical protein [Victivallaceae bacterium]
MHTIDFHRETCLTCQYFNCPRRVKMIGRTLTIEYDDPYGRCSLKPIFRMGANYPARRSSDCHYQRWVELPD